MEAAKNKHQLPEEQLEAMWMAYWNFAFAEKELYQLMFGVSMNCCMMQKSPEVEAPSKLVNDAIRQLMKNKNPTDDEICMTILLSGQWYTGLFLLTWLTGALRIK